MLPKPPSPSGSNPHEALVTPRNARLDTRTKILTLEQALALPGDQVLLVTGHFDVLQAANARELARLRDSNSSGALLIAVTDPPNPLLAPRARAEMVAAFAMVDYVVSLEDHQVDSFLAAFPRDRTVRLEAAHQQRMRELIEHVHRRQSQ